jgi:hypothetical protein
MSGAPSRLIQDLLIQDLLIQDLLILLIQFLHVIANLAS